MNYQFPKLWRNLWLRILTNYRSRQPSSSNSLQRHILPTCNRSNKTILKNEVEPILAQDRHPNLKFNWHSKVKWVIGLKIRLKLNLGLLKLEEEQGQQQRVISIKCRYSSLRHRSWWIITPKCPQQNLFSIWVKPWVQIHMSILIIKVLEMRWWWVKRKRYPKLFRAKQACQWWAALTMEVVNTYTTQIPRLQLYNLIREDRPRLLGIRLSLKIRPRQCTLI